MLNAKKGVKMAPSSKIEPSMDGIDLQKFGDVTQVIIEYLSDDLKKEIKENLTAYCNGASEARDDPLNVTLQNTLEEFFRTFDSKDKNVQIGLAGELLVHVLFTRTLPNLTSACVYFNLEEHNVKKGFDLTLVDESNGTLWYGEVKSGELGKFTTADEKARERITEAASGLHKMFKGQSMNSKRWMKAKAEANSALCAPQRLKVKQLLGDDMSLAKRQGGLKPNAVLAGIVMVNHTRTSLTSENSKRFKLSHLANEFKLTELLLLQQDEVETIVRYLREMKEEQSGD